jgi:PleD family two-component response regulator
VAFSVQSQVWVRDLLGVLDAGSENVGCCPIEEPFSPLQEARVHTLAPDRVFVVDDDSVIASTLATILRMHGLKVRFFVDPLEALEASRSA